MTEKYRYKVGKAGEDLAVKFLEENNYVILKRNFRLKFGEIDIIAKDKDTICFIEVKARKNLSYGAPFEAISKTKQRRMGLAALAFLQQAEMDDVKTRFDVVSVDLDSEGSEQIELFKNAFEIEEYI